MTLYPEIPGERLDAFLSRCAENLSRSAAQKLIDEGHVLRNGKQAKKNDKLNPGDVIEYTIPEPKEVDILPTEMPLDIVYEDEDIMVLNKPAGMPTHPSMDNYYNSLANGLAWYFQQQGKAFIFRCSNRLDRDTSGLTVVAKHMVSGNILSTMTLHREIHREYRAIVRGAGKRCPRLPLSWK